MNPNLACCAAAPCCPTSLPAFPAFTFRTGSVWPGAVGLGLVVAGALLTGCFVLVEVARALAAVRAS